MVYSELYKSISHVVLLENDAILLESLTKGFFLIHYKLISNSIKAFSD
jgi:hypothetical protein